MFGIDRVQQQIINSGRRPIVTNDFDVVAPSVRGSDYTTHSTTEQTKITTDILNNPILGPMLKLPSLLTADPIEKFLDLIGSEIQKLTPKLIDKIGDIIKQELPHAVDKTIEVVNSTLPHVQNSINKFIVEQGPGYFERFFNMIKQLAPKIRQFIEYLFVEFIPDIITSASKLIKNVSPQITDITRQLINDVATPIAIETSKGIKAILPDIGKDLGIIVRNAMPDILSGTKDFINEIDISGLVKQTVKQTGEEIRKSIQSPIEQQVKTVENIVFWTFIGGITIIGAYYLFSGKKEK